MALGRGVSMRSHSYLGSKGAAGTFQAIIAAMPAHETYVEAFRGTGKVLREKPASASSIAIDRDAEVFERWPSPAGTIDVIGDARSYLAELDYEVLGRVLIYADPPYVLETRTSSSRYRFDFTDQDHRDLAECLCNQVERGAFVMVSGYPSRLYEQLYRGWRSITFQAMTRGGVRTEQLWMSFPAGAEPFWHAYAGQDFTDRQRIKRKAERWAAKYAAMSAAERLAVMHGLLCCSSVGDGYEISKTGAAMGDRQ